MNIAGDDRPAAHLIVERFNDLVKNPLLSGSHVRKKAIHGSIGPPGEASLRSLYWRMYLNILSPSPAVWPESLKRLRRQWVDLHDYLHSPDGTWVEGAQPPQCNYFHPTSPTTCDPLGSESDNPWPQWYSDLELRRVIRQDVDRTFPEIAYFRQLRVKHTMTNILFCFAKLHVDVGYRQGMHEILAMVLWCTDLDSVEGTYLAEDLNSLAYLVLSRDYVEHDTYTLFSNLMTNMLSWYDPNLSIPTSFSGSSQLGAPGASIHVQPIVAKCARIHELLKKVDFELWKRMEELQIEPQIYGIRWLRLLFLREFPIAHSLTLWDTIFAEEMHGPLQLADYVCLAMLLRIRDSLLDADYSTFLQGLLRYPQPPDGNPRVLLLVQQASYLRDNPTNFGGAYLRRQNQQVGATAGIKSGTRAQEEMYEKRSGTPMSSGAPSRQATASTSALLDQGRSIAEGLYGRAEALGINRAVYSAIGDFRKSVQSYQAQQSWEPPSELMSRSSIQEDLGSVENAAMSSTLAASLEILRAELQKAQQPVSVSVHASLNAIEHVRDVLSGQIAHFNAQYANHFEAVIAGDIFDSLGKDKLNNSSVHTKQLPAPPQSNASDAKVQSPPTSKSIGDTNAPARSPAMNATEDHAKTETASINTSSLAPVLPKVAHNRAGNTKSSLPDLSSWQSNTTFNGSQSNLEFNSPRYPPSLRLPRQPGPERHLQQNHSPLNTPHQTHEHTERISHGSTDPLGALLKHS